jgi:hypothetical protein
MDVEDFVKYRVMPEYQDIVAIIRQLMHEMAPDAREMISYGILAWKDKRILALINPTRQGITFAFSRGAEFEDRYSLLKGKGNLSKHVKIRELKNINIEALRYYIMQALKFDNV